MRATSGPKMALFDFQSENTDGKLSNSSRSIAFCNCINTLFTYWNEYDAHNNVLTIKLN